MRDYFIQQARNNWKMFGKLMMDSKMNNLILRHSFIFMVGELMNE